VNPGRTKGLRMLGVVAVIALTAVGPVSGGPAGAASGGTDQITGNGVTDSAVTVGWTQGLLDSHNQPLAGGANADRSSADPTSPLSFMYPDFRNLTVTVGQTENLVHQSVKVTWSGFPLPATGITNFLQLMQCYGDADTGPNPQDCEYGSAGLLGNVPNEQIGSRTGNLCVPNSVPSVTDPPALIDGSAASNGCDPNEPADPADIDPGNAAGTTYSVPFVPVGDPTQKVYGPATDFYDRFNTNEVQNAATSTDGTGQQFFQTLTGTEASGLGCGEVETDGQARGCWLVIVPRGGFTANGVPLNLGFPNAVNDSPLGASNWAQRIQVHLGFNPIQSPCPIGSADETAMVGTELAARAVSSWELALNQVANCSVIYGYTSTPEPTSTTQLAADSGGAGLAFTTIPIGSEAARGDGGGGAVVPGTGPPLLYAPVAVSAMTFAFNVNLPGTAGFDATPIKLTPRLVAKALTQSYRTDLPEFQGDGSVVPDWAKNNPDNITQDPEFRALNPGVSEALGTPAAPLITEDHSAVNQQIWQWIDADPAARTWLSGTADENGMRVNPAYQTLKLGSSAIDSYPRADSTCADLGQSPDGRKEEVRCTLDLIPYVENLDSAGAAVASANSPEGASWDPTALAPDGSAGFWGKGAVEIHFATFLWAFTDSASLANYGLVPADLCDAKGNNCVGPDASSVGTALAGAKADGTGLLHVNPATVGSGGYPLVNVTYAAVRGDQSAPLLSAYAAFIRFAASTGQTAGVDPGQLPHGYLPLPAALQAQALHTAAELTAPKPPAGSGGSGSSGGGGGVPLVSSGGPTGSGGPATVGQHTGPAAAQAAGPVVGGPASTRTLPVVLTRATPNQLPGAIRWVVVVVVIAGAACLLSGGLLRSRKLVPTVAGWFRRTTE
jgi:hypothetical protein